MARGLIGVFVALQALKAKKATPITGADVGEQLQHNISTTVNLM